jgi:hypothetical protein
MAAAGGLLCLTLPALDSTNPARPITAINPPGRPLSPVLPSRLREGSSGLDKSRNARDEDL